jgi:hypothetical protein
VLWGWGELEINAPKAPSKWERKEEELKSNLIQLLVYLQYLGLTWFT